MYPRVTDIFPDLFGFEFPVPLFSFGLMVAVALLTAAWLTRKELDRLYVVGRLKAVEVKEPGKNGRVKTVKASPSVLVWTMLTLAAVFGVAGSKLFHIVDYWERFVLDPVGMLFSTSGLTFYGGLICAGLAIAYYAKKKGLRVPLVADALAPGLILGYGIGRIGCYLSGDGDWGICSNLADKPGWIPGFLWSETFPRNILNVDVVTDTIAKMERNGMSTEVCQGATGVYPTMLYEFALGAVLCGVLWALRTHPFKAGWLFSLYLVFNGVERFLIETIRLNPELSWIGLSQAQFIAVLIVLAGAAGLALTTRRRAADPVPATS
ncbi:MAG: prolipoprotein diacylglyceryl transferase family protein [Bacteroidota bacterium]